MNLIELIRKSINNICTKYIEGNIRDVDEMLPIFYVAGSQTLPPPVDSLEGETLLKKLDNDTNVRQILVENINEKKLKKSKCGYGLVTFSLSERRGLELYKEEIPEGKLHDYILASSRLPGFKQEELDGKYYLDGRFC